MPRFSEMSPKSQWLTIVVLAMLAFAGSYFGLLKSMAEQNKAELAKLEAKNAEIANLRQFEPKLGEMDAQIARLKLQIEIQKKIVPDEKEADKFIQLVQDTANSAGIEVRRFTAKPMATREFYTEVPFEMEIDGPYFAVLNFFERLSKLERIINVDNLAMATVKKPTGVVKTSYQYAPHESVVAAYMAKTFFANAEQPAAPAAPAVKK